MAAAKGSTICDRRLKYDFCGKGAGISLIDADISCTENVVVSCCRYAQQAFPA